MGHSDFFSVLEPEHAARVLDMDYIVEETLGNFGSGRDRFEVAGAIDRRLKDYFSFTTLQKGSN